MGTWAHDSVHGTLHGAQFTTTCWSAVVAAGEPGSEKAAAALDGLCRTYWPPLYAFARRHGHAPEEARDLTQEFFAHLIEKNLAAHADRERGRFRSFLVTAFKNFLSHERHRTTALRRGGGQNFVSLDELEPEERYLLEPVDAATPDAIFDQRWALQQVDSALNHLRDEYQSSDRGPLFDLLKGYVWGDKNARALAQIASELDLTEEAVKKALQRLRHRFRDALRAEIARTVSTPDQIDAELRYLRAALTISH